MHLLAKYGVEFVFEAPVVKKDDTDLAATGDWTPAGGDVKVSKDGGNVANVGTLPTAVGGAGSVLWTWTLSATEMQAKRITIQVVDAALEDQVFIVQTYGNASAQHAVDLGDSVRAGLTALPNAAADAAGGLVISDAGGLDADAMATSVTAIEVDTGTTLDGKINTIDTVVDATKVVTDQLVAAQAEPTGVPSATATPLVKLATLFMMANNEVTVTANKKTFKDAAGGSEFEKDLSDDGTTYTETKTNAV